jgi:hypothetical protein
MLLGCAALAGLSGVGIWKGWKNGQKVEEEKAAAMGTFVPYEHLGAQNQGNLRMSLQNDAKSGMVDLYKQEIRTTTTLRPYDAIGFDWANLTPTIQSGVMTDVKQDIAFENYPFKSIFVNPTFGRHNLIARNTNAYHRSFWNRDRELHDSVNKTNGGEDIQRTLSNDFGIREPLRNDKMYHMKYFSVQHRPLFFTGAKVGNNYVYDNVATDPATVVNAEFQPKVESAQGLVTLGCVGVGLSVVAALVAGSK